MAISWETDRGQLNHNWLQNGVLVGLNHALGIVTGAIRSRYVRRKLAEDIQRWQDRRQDLPRFLGRFVNEMSPKIYFDRIPLCRCSDETKQWLVPLIHNLWLRREHIEKKLVVATDAYRKAEKTYEQLHMALEKLPESPSAEELQSLQRILRDFTTACENLSRAISAFPHEIRYV